MRANAIGSCVVLNHGGGCAVDKMLMEFASPSIIHMILLFVVILVNSFLILLLFIFLKIDFTRILINFAFLI